MTDKGQFEDAGREAASSAVLRWLARLDRGDYTGSWRSGSGYLRGQISESEFAQRLAQAHTDWLAPPHRELARSQRATELPAAPVGDYWVFEFIGAKCAGAPVTERVTAVFEGEAG